VSSVSLVGFIRIRGEQAASIKRDITKLRYFVIQSSIDEEFLCFVISIKARSLRDKHADRDQI